MAWSDGLSGDGLDIARATERRLRVTAGPGTGKSFAMQRRMMRLLEEEVAPERLLVVTFTRTAAAALVQDIARLNTPGCDRIPAGTLHAYCFGLLMRQNVLSWTNRVPRTLVTFSDQGILRFEAEPLLEDISRVGAFGTSRDLTKRVRANEAAWARLQTDAPGPPQRPLDVQFRDELLSWLRFHRAMLIGEVIPETLRYLQNNPANPESSAFEHVLVDEYQDLNRAEQVLLEELASGGHFAVFGDEDQSIYSFRFAHPTGIVDFNNADPESANHRLAECRRCPKRVVAVADSLIRNNHPANGGLRLCPRPANGEGEVHIVQWDTLQNEANGVAAFVGSLLKERYRPGEVLILCPRRLIAYGIRDALVASNIPLHSFFHEEALETPESRRAFALLTLAARPKDRVALRYWLGEGSNTWNARGYAELRRHCEETGSEPWDSLEQLSSGKLLLPHCKPLVTKFKDLQIELARLAGLEPAGLVDATLPEGECWAATLRFFATQGGLENLDLDELIARLRESITQPELPENIDCIQLMSLHKSKGLTRKVVIVVGCMQGLIPNISSAETDVERDANLREQRRLFYVAITRCTEVLLLSSVAKIETKVAHQLRAVPQKIRGEFTYPIASTFFGELGLRAPRSLRGDVFLKSLGL